MKEHVKKRGKSSCFVVKESKTQLYKRGIMVWGKLQNFPWWPAICIDAADCYQTETKSGHSWLFWFGDHKFSEMSFSNICNFEDEFNVHADKEFNGLFKTAILEALKINAIMKKVELKGPDRLLKWAADGFQVEKQDSQNSASCSMIQSSSGLPPQVIRWILKPKMVACKEKKNVIEINKNLCISCYRMEERIVMEHPLLIGGICKRCKKDVTRACHKPVGVAQSVCIICGQGGTLIFCTRSVCHRAYCNICLTYMAPVGAFDKIRANENWKCYVCEDDKDLNCEIRCKKVKFEKTDIHFPFQKPLIKKPINVLAFDDCAKTVLKRLNMEIGIYSTGQNAIPPEKENSIKSYTESFFKLSLDMISDIDPDIIIGNYINSCIPNGLRSISEACFMCFIKFVQRLYNARDIKKENVYFIFFTDACSVDEQMKSRFSGFLGVNAALIKLRNNQLVMWTNIFREISAQSVAKYENAPSNLTAEELVLYILLEHLKTEEGLET